MDNTETTSEETRKTNADDQVFVFPDLVYIELIALLAATVILLVWSMAQDAPLRGIANPNKTENPAKAPWYFVGLQELLVYFDPWIAGVAIPIIIVVGLMLIPYLDTNRVGTGRYSFRGRKLAITNFVFGFALWFILILVGQFLRGPNWQFYGPGESWDVAKSAETALVNLPAWAGVMALLAYFGGGLVLPAFLFKGLWKEMGATRYITSWILVLLMYSVVIKVALRLLFRVKYVLETPWFNL